MAWLVECGEKIKSGRTEHESRIAHWSQGKPFLDNIFAWTFLLVFPLQQKILFLYRLGAPWGRGLQQPVILTAHCWNNFHSESQSVSEGIKRLVGGERGLGWDDCLNIDHTQHLARAPSSPTHPQPPCQHLAVSSPGQCTEYWGLIKIFPRYPGASQGPAEIWITTSRPWVSAQRGTRSSGHWRKAPSCIYIFYLSPTFSLF